MAKPVKDEIFGTRNSVLKPRLDVAVFANIFFATCLRRINPDPASRYMLLRECASPEEYEDPGFRGILPFFQPGIRIGNVHFAQDGIRVNNVRNREKAHHFPDTASFARALLGFLKCTAGPLQPSRARVIENDAVSPLSRLLRAETFGRTGSTDVDFLILNRTRRQLIFLEEKLYLDEQGGSLGHGQYLSFREIIGDAFVPAMREQVFFYLLFFPDTAGERVFVYDFRREWSLPRRTPAFTDPQRREQRIRFPFPDMQETTVSKFLGREIFG